jgi:hypothetical protein
VTALDAIRIAVRDLSEVIGVRTVAELPAHLEDPEDRAVCREYLDCLYRAAGSHGVTVGQAVELLETADEPSRVFWLDACRRVAGLPSLADARHQQRLQEVNTMRNPFRGLIRPANESYFIEVPPTQPIVGVRPGGALYDIEQARVEDQKARLRQCSLEAARQQEHFAAQQDATSRTEFERAVRDEWQKQTPKNFGGLQ